MDTRYSALARKYAQAFLNLFMDRLSIDDCLSLVKLKYFFKSHKQALFFLSLHHISLELKMRFIDEIIVKFNLKQEFRKLFEVLLEHNRCHLIIDVLRKICSIYRARNNVILFTISSSYPLEVTSLEILENFLARQTGSTIIGIPQVDKNLIAGIRMQSENYLWEYSLKKQLQRLKRAVESQ